MYEKITGMVEHTGAQTMSNQIAAQGLPSSSGVTDGEVDEVCDNMVRMELGSF